MGQAQFKLIKVVETNPHIDPRFANNGGGYSQPFYYVEVGQHTFRVENRSCGDFGSRVEVYEYHIHDNPMMGTYIARFGTMYKSYEEFSRIPKDLADILSEATGIYIPNSTEIPFEFAELEDYEFEEWYRHMEEEG